MKINRALISTILVLTACSQALPQATHTPAPPTVTPTSSLPTPIIETTKQPEVSAALGAFLEAWKKLDHATMYGMITKAAQAAIKPEDFNKLYADTETALTLETLDYTLGPTTAKPGEATATTHLTYKSNLFGEFSRDLAFKMLLEDGVWKIQWHDGLIMPEMGGGNRLKIDQTSQERASIFDKYGSPLAAPTKVVAIGVIPGQINANTEEAMNTLISTLTGIPWEDIFNAYQGAGADWYIPIGEATVESVQNNQMMIKSFPAIVTSDFDTRYSYTSRGVYFQKGVAPQVIGYIQPIPADQAEAYKRLGYQGNEQVGVAGLEKSQEKYLAGTHGASLTLYNPGGQAVSRLAQVETQAPQNITTTLDTQLQVNLEKSLQDFRGAIVVMERDTGRILAMVSSPGYDQNRFVAANPNNQNGVLLQKFLNNENRPLLNRAAQASYPLGSVFKIITMAAALETGVFNNDSTWDCQNDYREIPGLVLDDWTKAKGYPPSGVINLSGGLIRSCNPWFYHIGYELFSQGYNKAVSDMARAFGLGKATGIGQIAEDEGNIPDPQSVEDAAQFAIGQGTTLVTPLQVARFIAAVGNGGTLYKPTLIEKIVGPSGTPTYTFQPESTGTLPVSPEHLKIIQEAMHGVIYSKKPLGTARSVLASMGENYNLYGKTGTATTSEGTPHSWFGGYTEMPSSGKPDIAVAVIVEFAGEGSEVAAPMFERVVSLYYTEGLSAGDLLPWESRVYKLSEATATPTITPSPTPTRVPAQ
jgi:penicillin-binding protein 2